MNGYGFVYIIRAVQVKKLNGYRKEKLCHVKCYYEFTHPTIMAFFNAFIWSNNIPCDKLTKSFVMRYSTSFSDPVLKMRKHIHAFRGVSGGSVYKNMCIKKMTPYVRKQELNSSETSCDNLGGVIKKKNEMQR
jgi:hypothetical protein